MHLNCLWIVLCKIVPMKNSVLITTVFISLVPVAVLSQEKLIVKGLKITNPVVIKKGIYKIDGTDNLEKSIILIEGENITVDFKNAVLKGSNTKKNPAEFFGVAVLIQNSKNVTIK